MEQLDNDWIVVGDVSPGESQDSESTVFQVQQEEVEPTKAWYDKVCGAELDERLVDWVVRSRSAETPWTRIARDLGNGLSASDCEERWQELSGGRDLVLRPAPHAAVGRASGLTSEGRQSAAEQSTATATNIQKQSTSTQASHTHGKLCKPYHSCMWTAQEDADLQELIKHTNWIGVSTLMGKGRSPWLCRTRYKWLYWKQREAYFAAHGVEPEEIVSGGEFSEWSSSEEDSSDDDEPADLPSPHPSTLKRKASNIESAETTIDAATRLRFCAAAEALSIDPTDQRRIMNDLSARGWTSADLEFMETLQRPEQLECPSEELKMYWDYTGTNLHTGPFHGPMGKFFISMKDATRGPVLSRNEELMRLEFFRVARPLTATQTAFRSLWAGLEKRGFRADDLEAMQETLRRKSSSSA